MKAPVGEICPYAGDTAPTGFLICDGSAVSRTDYADLFAVIGEDFGAGNGTTTFNIPNLKGRAVFGYKSTDTDFDAVGETGGANSANLAHTHTESAHTHAISGNLNASANGNNTDLGSTYTVTGSSHTHTFSGTSGNASATATDSQLSATQDMKKPYITLNFVIRHTFYPDNPAFLLEMV